MVAALAADPDTADWVREKGQAAGQRELHRIWDKAGEQANAIAQVMAEFNKRYLVVNEAGKAVVYAPGYDAALRRRRFDRHELADLRALYMNRQIEVGVDKEGAPITRSAANVWLINPERRQFIHGITFDPSGAEPEDGVLNLWQGFAFEPVESDWSLLRQHIGRVLCCRDPTRFNYLMGWMARMVQRPAEQGEVAVVMRGGEGTGKGTVAKALLRLLGQHGMAISNAKHLVGNFNGHLRDAVLLFADEAFFAGDKAHVGTLKSLITEPYLTVEAKFQNAVQTPNRLHLILASNEEWVVPASLDARRFFVLEVSEDRKGDHDYFAAIQQQMDNGGYAAMLYDLLHMDLTTFNVRDVPITDGLVEQRKLSLPVPEAWWRECLDRGYVFRSRLGLHDVFGHWLPDISTELLHLAYSEFAKERHERHPLSREALGRFMRQMGAKSARFSNLPIGEHATEKANNYGDMHRRNEPIMHPRPMGFALGNIALARQEFAEATGLTVNWSDPEP